MEIEEVEGGGGGGGDRVEMEMEMEMHLAWEDLTVVVPDFGNGPTKRLISGLNGYAQPGRILAIMGPSGSGKSTLLDTLAGRLPGNVVMTGNIHVNGKRKRLEYGGLAYVTQENVLLGTLTVRETLMYSACLRLPSSMSKQEVSDIVESTISEMGLQDCSDRRIGNWHMRGISGGEKKRVSIALEILTRPQLLFLDEPTSGLDSASAFFVVQILKNIAHAGKTVVSAIHQPSSEVFALFDHLCLLSGGVTVYFGEAKLAAKFFAEAGFPCPKRRSVSDHYLRCINSDFDNITAVLTEYQRICETQSSSDPLRNLPTAGIKARLISKYQHSEYALRAKAKIQEISNIEELDFGKMCVGQAKWWKQLSTLTKRSTINMSRDLGYYWLRIAIYIALSICVGTVFYNLGTNYPAIFARGACGGFISGFMAFMSIGGFPSFIEEMKVFHRERLNGHYGIGVYMLSNFLSSTPFLIIMSLACSSITYYMVKFHTGISHFVYVFLDLICSIAAIESFMMMIASMVPNFLMGIIVGAGYLGIMMMTSGFFRLLPDLPTIFWRYPVSYINHATWALQGAYKNDMIGAEFDPLERGGPKLKGEFILKTMLGVNLDYSKWWDLVAVAGILICYRLFFYAILKFRERATPFFRTLYAKRTLHHLKKRPSFRKTPAFPSKRHQVLHSLSSQEGLNSPI